MFITTIMPLSRFIQIPFITIIAYSLFTMDIVVAVGFASVYGLVLKVFLATVFRICGV